MDNMDKFQMLSAILELSMRVGTGGRMVRISMVQFCKETYGTKGRTEKAVLAEMLGKWEETYGERFEMESAYERAGLKTQESEA